MIPKNYNTSATVDMTMSNTECLKLSFQMSKIKFILSYQGFALCQFIAINVLNEECITRDQC